MIYVIVEGNTRSSLIEQVNDYIKQGYVPQGGVAIQTKDEVGFCGCYWQAMIKDESI